MIVMLALLSQYCVIKIFNSALLLGLGTVIREPALGELDTAFCLQSIDGLRKDEVTG